MLGNGFDQVRNDERYVKQPLLLPYSTQLNRRNP